jgi:hypothetical protein
MTATNLCNDLSDILQQVVLDIVEDSIEKWCTDIFESLLNPLLEVKELPFSGKDAKCHCETVVVPISKWNETFSDILCDIEYPRQVQT